MKRVRRTVDFDTKQLSEEGDYFTFEGLASTFDRDLVGDIIEPGAFKETIQRSMDRAARRGKQALIPALFNHDPSKPIGRFVELRETDDGLFAKGELRKDSDLAAGTVIPAIKAEAVAAMSIGFFIDSKRFEGDTRHIERLTLVEASLVTFPANEGAEVTSYKACGLTVDELDHMNIREIERHFMDGYPVSRKLAVKISAMLKGRQRDADQPLQRDAGERDVENVALTAGQFDILLSLKRRPDARSSPQSVRSC